jgi:hypothetical protein
MTGAGRSTRAGFWWAEAFVLAALALVALAAIASFRLCTGSLGCEGGGSQAGAASIVLFGLAALAFLAVPYVAARASGRAPAAGAAGLSIAAGLGAFAVGAAAFELVAGEPLPALVPAVGALGGVAVRVPFRRAVRTRCWVAGGLTLLALVLAAAGAVAMSALLALLVLPAMAFAEAPA